MNASGEIQIVNNPGTAYEAFRAGAITAAGNISGANLSGTNTGDQTNISGTAASETLATVTGRGASTTAAITISREATAYGGTTQSFLVDGAAGNAALTINAAANYAYLNFAQAGVTKFEIGAEGAATNKGSLYFNHNIQVGSAGAALYIKKSNGFVGILNIAPTTALDVGGAGTFSGTISASNYSGTHSGTSSGTNTGDQTNISGNAATATNATTATYVASPDGGRNAATTSLPNTNPRTVRFDFATSGTIGGTGNYGGVMTYTPWDGTSASTGDSSYQLAFLNETGVNASGVPGLSIRNGINSAWNGTWYRIITSGNIGSQSVSNATTAGGLAVHTGTNNNANQIVRTDANGYIQAGWINSISGDNGTSAITRIYASDDAYIRYYTPTNFRAVLDVPTRTGGSASGTWGINVTGTAGSSTSASYATFLTSSNYIQRCGSSGNANTDFQNTPAGSVRHNGDDAGLTNSPGGSWWFYDNYRHSNASNYWGIQVAWGWEDNANRLATRNITGNSFGGWVYYINSGNIGSQSVAYATSSGTSTGTSQTVFSTLSSNGALYAYNGIQMYRNGAANTGISWYNASYYNWQEYMASAGATGCGPNSNLTAPSGLYQVTSWALRSRMETVGSYGWLWEVGGGGGGVAAGSAVMELDVYGNLRTAADVIAYASDGRLKTNVKVIENALSKVQAIRGVEYDWLDNIYEDYGFKPTKMHEVGVIAQEVELVLPEVVLTAPFNGAYKDKHGIDPNFLTVKYDRMVPLLIEAIKELNNKIEKLEAQLASK